MNRKNSRSLLLVGILIVLLIVALTSTESEYSLQRNGGDLVGRSRTEVLELRGTPEQKIVKTYGPGWGPAEALGDKLENGEQYEEWDYRYGKLHLLVWFYPINSEATALVIKTGTHLDGRVY